MRTNDQARWLEPEEVPVGEWRSSQQRLQNQVELQSSQIEQVLSRHNLPAGISGGSVRDHWVSFDLATQVSTGWDRLRRLTGELAAALGVPEVKLERHQGTLRLAVKRFDPHPVDLLDLLEYLPEVGGLSLALGLDHQGHPVLLNLNQADLKNILVAGVSGAGKSSLLRSIAVSLALTCRQATAQLAVIGLGSSVSGIAGRPNPLYPLNYLPHLLFPVATTPDEAVEALEYLVEESDYRADNGISVPMLLVMVDDADMLLRRAGSAAAEHLAALLHAPAEAGVQVMIGAADPALPDLYDILHHNVDLRLVGRMADERGAMAAAGNEQSYAQFLNGKGDFLAVSAAGLTPFQAAYIDDYDLHLTLTELHRSIEPVLLAQDLNVRPSMPPSWSMAGAQGFTYDGASGRARMEPSDRSTLRTIEIVVDQQGDQGSADARLSWLEHVDITDELPRRADEEGYNTVTGEGADAQSAAEDAGSAGVPVDDSSPLATARPESSRRDGSDQGDDDTDDVRPAPAVGDSSENEALNRASVSGNLGGGYQMLPFGDEVEETGRAAVSGQHPEEPDAGPGLSATGRAQALWPVEPTYTDIDDDTWDASDPDEDDWRRRLH